MRKTRQMRAGYWGILAAATLLMALMIGFFSPKFTIISRAEAEGTVTATTANIRKEADASSDIIGSTEKGKKISIKSEKKDANGTLWYQVYVDSDTLGFIRSDLVQKGEGTVSTLDPDTPAETPETPAPDPSQPATEVTQVQPVSATVTGGTVRVRSNASTSGSIVATVKKDVVLTVTGYAEDSEGKTWYQVNFLSDNAEVNGFIREDFASLSGELTPPEEEEPQPGEEQPSDEPAEEPEETKKWETQLQGEDWYLINNEKSEQFQIDKIFSAAEANAKLYEQSQSAVKKEKVAIIILVILVVILAASTGLLVFKIKDMTDEAYFSEVERETVRNRSGNKPPGGQNRRVMQTVGSERAGTGSKPAGTRPTEARTTGAGMAGARPAGAPQGTGQPRNAGARPTGAGMAGANSTGARPAGAPQGTGKPRNAGARPAGAGVAGASQTGTNPTGARPAGASQGTGQPRNAGARPTGNPQKPNPGWKSKNFMTDEDDEFEFEFLNWNGDEEQ